MYKKNVFILILTIFLTSSLISFAQKPPVGNQPPHAIQPPSQAVLLQNIPPIILIAGKEKDSFQKVFIDKVKIGAEINVKLIMFVREPSETIKTNTYGLPASAKLDVKKDEKAKNRAEGTLSWKLVKSDKGFHTIIIEVSNSKGSVNRISLSYDVS